jgi:hypothetical protein
VLTTCNATGSGTVPGGTDCAQSGQVCTPDGCKTPICVPNQDYCDADTVKHCSDDGLSATVVDTCVAGETCTAATCVCNSPTTWYRDEDGDGFGDPVVTASACAAPEGYVADDTDCYDHNAQAKPQQGSGWSAVDRGDGSFDFNCDGVEKPEWGTGQCNFNGSTCGLATPGFYTAIPACGERATFLESCGYDGLYCVRKPGSMRTQLCF